MSASGSAVGAPAAPGAARLRRGLSSFGVLLLTLSALSPVGSIFGFGSDVLQHVGTGAVLLMVVGVLAALVWATIYGELGSAFPFCGADYVGVGAVLGSWAGAVVLAIWVALSGPAAAFSCKVVATYLGALAPDVAPSAIEYGALAAALGVALFTVRTSAVVTGIFLAIEMLAVLAITLAGALHPLRSIGAMVLAPQVADGAGALGPVPLAAMSLTAISAIYACIGGNQALFFGEELIEPHRRMGPVVVTAALLGALATALPIVFVLQGARDLAATVRSATPFTDILAQVAGPGAGRALSAGVALAVFNCAIVQVMLCARLFYSMGRDRIFGARASALFARVHAPSGVPRVATWFSAAFTALCCLADSHALVVFLSGTTSFLFALVSLTVLVGRARRQTALAGYWRAPAHPLLPLLGLGIAAAMFIGDLLDADTGRPSLLILALMIGSALAWYHFVLARRPGGWAPRVFDQD